MKGGKKKMTQNNAYESEILEKARSFIDSFQVNGKSERVFSSLVKGIRQTDEDVILNTKVSKLVPKFDEEKGLYLFDQDITFRSRWFYGEKAPLESEFLLAYLLLDENQYENLEREIKKSVVPNEEGFIKGLGYQNNHPFDSVDFSRDFNCKNPLTLGFNNSNGFTGYTGGDVHPSGKFSLGEDHYGWEKFHYYDWTDTNFNGKAVLDLITLSREKARG
jgi:hypothetical protein